MPPREEARMRRAFLLLLPLLLTIGCVDMPTKEYVAGDRQFYKTVGTLLTSRWIPNDPNFTESEKEDLLKAVADWEHRIEIAETQKDP